MAEDPLQQLAGDNNQSNERKKNSILNELDDLDNKVIISPVSSQSDLKNNKTKISNIFNKKKKKIRSNSAIKTNIRKTNIRKTSSNIYQNGMIINGDCKNNIFKNNSLSIHPTHTLKPTILSNTFVDEYETMNKLHNESAMLHCGASYVLTEDDIIDGEIHLTNYLLYFIPNNIDDIPGGIHHLRFPIATISKITEQQRSNNFTEIVLINRIYRCLRFRFASDKSINYISSDKVLQMLRALAFPSRMLDLFAFEYYKRHPSVIKLMQYNKHNQNHHNKSNTITLTSPRRDNIIHVIDDEKNNNNNNNIWGWDMYDIEKEYNRMGIYMTKDNNNETTTTNNMQRHREYTSTRMPLKNDKNNKLSKSKSYPRYRFTSVNKGYAICDSYPELLIVPSSITDWELTQVGRFRRLGRIPILSWKPLNSNVALFRASQPKVAMASNRSRADEHLIQSIAEANTIQNSILHIMDARPKLNARVNKMRGGGFENVNFYKNTHLEFLNIDNIHIMRKSRKSLSNLIYNLSYLKSSRDKEWYNSLHNTEWMCHIRELLKGTYTMIRVLTKEKSSILCHCSDGWDRTSQLCSLVELCLDSYYRSIKGFCILIEKEWLSVGHQFDKRCGHRKDDSFEEDERSPIFEQFIECTFQLLIQYPLYFEFNQMFLINILDNLYSCKYGTFLCDKLKDRKEYKLHEKTISLWTFLQNNRKCKKYINIYYKPTNKCISPKYSLKILKFWTNWHLRNCPQHIMKKKPMYADNGQQQITQLYIDLKNENEKLRQEIQLLRKQNDTPQIHYKQDSLID